MCRCLLYVQCLFTGVNNYLLLLFFLSQGHCKVVKYLVEHVTQFPSDADLTRYVNTLSDKASGPCNLHVHVCMYLLTYTAVDMCTCVHVCVVHDS